MMDRPLAGRRVMVTQAAGSGRAASALERRGAEVWAIPIIEIAPPADWADADAALAGWTGYDWVVFTSGNAVRAVVERLKMLGLFDAAPRPRIAVVGAATARVVESAGWRIRVRPSRQSADGLAAALVDGQAREGATALFPKGDIAREVVPGALRAAGMEVRETVVYRTVPAEIDGEAVRTRLLSGEVDGITFTSPSTAEFFVRAVGGEIWSELPESVVVASIGPTTSAKLRSLGRPPDIEAARPSADALADALATAFARG